MRILMFVALFLVVVLGHAQEDDERMKKIEAARIAYITQELDLTPEQAEKFWPVYREYLDKKRELRNEYREARQEVGKPLSEEQSKQMLEKGHQFKQRQLDLDKNYADRLNTIITTRQILQLRKAEDDFRQLLLERLDRRNQQRERLQRRDDRRNNDN